MRLLSILKIPGIIICLALLMSCEKKDNLDLPYINISSVNDNELFFRTKVYVEIKTSLLNYQIENIAYYMDNILVGELPDNPSEYEIELSEYDLGVHILKVVLKDISGNEASDEKRIIIHHTIGESPDMVDFSEGIPDTWEINSWQVNSNLGYESSHSLQLSEETGSILTTKTYEKEGNVNFRIKNTGGELFFYIDGKLKSKWFGEQDWFSYSYYVGEGPHTFKWKGASPTITMDDIRFVEDTIAHSLGEYFGGGIIYHLDSTKQHGLIASKDDLGSEIWGCGDFIFDQTLNIDDGAANTLTILSLCDDIISAARLSADYIVSEDGNIYDDWFLPAPSQLGWLYEKRELVSYKPMGIYWNSFSFTVNVEEFVIVSSVLLFSDGTFHGALRSSKRLVRPIRAF